VAILDHAAGIGLEGVFFRTVLDMSPTLDPGALREIRDAADERGLYLEAGLGKVNPFATAETPELRALGEGDIVLGARRVLEAAAAIGVCELWAGTANYKSQYHGIYGFDRFRTDVDWSDQLDAVVHLLNLLAPIARDLGVHINLETHEEITSFELVRIIEKVGPDAIGIVFDTANVLHRAEDPRATARRIAPYVRQTHLKDAALRWTAEGVEYQLRPCGQGVVDFAAVAPLLVEHNPGLNLTLECDDAREPGEMPMIMLVELDRPEFLAHHPDLTPAEVADYCLLVDQHEQRVRDGAADSFEAYAAKPFGPSEWDGYVTTSAAHIRGVLRARKQE
jgi:sugar phosphate isomerase/epimerase